MVIAGHFSFRFDCLRGLSTNNGSKNNEVTWCYVKRFVSLTKKNVKNKKLTKSGKAEGVLGV